MRDVGPRTRNLGDPEVEHFDRRKAVRPPDAEKVRRLEIAVNDAETVRLGHRLARLQDEFDRLLATERASLLHPFREIFAFQVLHDHVRAAVFERPHVAHPRHVLTLDLRSCARFAFETSHGFGVDQRVGTQELDGHSLVEPEMSRCNDDAHPPRTEHALDAVFADEHVAFSYPDSLVVSPCIRPPYLETPRKHATTES